MSKIRDLFKNIGDIKGIFHSRMDTVNDRNGKDLETEETESGKNTQKLKKVLMTRIAMKMWSLT